MLATDPSSATLGTTFMGPPLPPGRTNRLARLLAWTATVVWLLTVGVIAVLMVLDDPGVTHWMMAAMVTAFPPVIWHAIIRARASGRMLRDWARGRGARYARKADDDALPSWVSGAWLVPGWRRRYSHVMQLRVRQRDLFMTQLTWTERPDATHGPYLVAACRISASHAPDRARFEERSLTNRLLDVVGADGVPDGGAEWTSGVPAFDERYRVRTSDPAGSISRRLLDPQTIEALTAVHGVEADVTGGLVAVRRSWRSQLDPAVVDELCAVLLLLAEDLERTETMPSTTTSCQANDARG
jgi:hypothetical protein